MVVDVKNLVKRYDRLVALDYINISVEEGDIYGFLGPGGSGKTTLIHCLLSLLKYDKGSIEIFGKLMSPDEYDIKKEIGYVMQNEAIFEELTVYENVLYFCSLYIKDPLKAKLYTEEAIAFTALEDYKKILPRKLNDGLLRRLNFACGIAHKPKLIILDEPALRADPQSRNKILDGVLKLNHYGATIIYASHDMEEIEQLCSKIAMMDKGRVVAVGTKDELKGMISLGEKITVEAYNITENQIEEMKNLSNISSVEYSNNQLLIKSKRGKNNLIHVLDYLQNHEVNFGRIYTEMPNINDVYLEITGKEL